jgi:three-Cys-motif partner protein
LEKVPAGKALTKFIFIDDDPRCIKLLNEQLRLRFPERPRGDGELLVTPFEGKCVDVLGEQLTRHGAWGQPILAVLDSWGNAPISYSLLRRIAHNRASEVIVTFGPQHFVRFVTELGPKADEVFGGDQRWREVRDQPDGEAKRQHLLDCYRRTLQSAGFRHLLDFELVDRRGEVLYLIFATNHPRGVEKMKDTLWEVDPVSGVGFRDPRDEQREALFDVNEPILNPLVRLLLPRIEQAGAGGVRVRELRDFALHETIYRPQHVAPALQPLLDAGTIRSDPPYRVRASGQVWIDRT